MRKIVWASGSVLVAVLAIAIVGMARRGTAIDPAVARAAEFTSRDGNVHFRVPQPTDAEWSDYQEMLRHPAYRSSGTGTAGFAMPYDPEWRAVERGRRDAKAVDIALEHSAASADELAVKLLVALREGDAEPFAASRLTRDEFLELCWPEFPQSRPYLKIPPDEAWSFQLARSNECALVALRQYGGKAWVPAGVVIGKSTAFRNFTLHEKVVVRAIDPETGRLAVLDFMPSLVEREGQFKVFLYGE